MGLSETLLDLDVQNLLREIADATQDHPKRILGKWGWKEWDVYILSNDKAIYFIPRFDPENVRVAGILDLVKRNVGYRRYTFGLYPLEFLSQLVNQLKQISKKVCRPAPTSLMPGFR